MVIITKLSEIDGWLLVFADSFERFAVFVVTGLQQTYKEK